MYTSRDNLSNTNNSMNASKKSNYLFVEASEFKSFSSFAAYIWTPIFVSEWKAEFVQLSMKLLNVPLKVEDFWAGILYNWKDCFAYYIACLSSHTNKSIKCDTVKDRVIVFCTLYFVIQREIIQKE